MSAICFTGQRPNRLYGYDESSREKYSELKNSVVELCASLQDKHGVTKFISGGAQGADQICFWAVESLKAEGRWAVNAVYIPFEGQQDMWGEDTMFGKREYARMLKCADEVRNCERDGRSIPQLLYDRNHCMVDDSDLVVCIWNRSERPGDKGTGGAGECVRYAVSKGKPVLVVDLLKRCNYRLRA